VCVLCVCVFHLALMNFSEEEFDKLLEGQILDPEAGETEQTHPWKISEDALEAVKPKVCVCVCVCVTRTCMFTYTSIET